jgi:molecular chaperone IbpA
MNKININTTTLPGFLADCGIGFGHMLDLIDTVSYTNNDTYPPYNVIQVDSNNFVVELAIAGFTLDNLEITQDRSKLIVAGHKAEEATDVTYLHRGISSRAFKREFVIAEYVSVESASVENGIMRIALRLTLPDTMQPRSIKITTSGK